MNGTGGLKFRLNRQSFEGFRAALENSWILISHWFKRALFLIKNVDWVSSNPLLHQPPCLVVSLVILLWTKPIIPVLGVEVEMIVRSVLSDRPDEFVMYSVSLSLTDPLRNCTNMSVVLEDFMEYFKLPHIAFFGRNIDYIIISVCSLYTYGWCSPRS